MKKIALLFLLTATVSLPSYAQRYMGVATSNWGGINSMYLNPAYLADSKSKLLIDVMSLNAGIDNSLGKINTDPGIRRFISGENTNIKDVFNFTDKDKFSLLAPYADIKGPGLIYSFNAKHTIAVSTRVRGFNQFHNFDQSIYRTITDSEYTKSGDIMLHSENFNWTAHLWGEFSVGYGGVLYEKGNHSLKVGGTIHFLTGIGFFGLKGKNLDANYLKGADSFYANNLDVAYSSNIFSTENVIRTKISPDNFIDKFFGENSSSGISGDIGVVYDYIENPGKGVYTMDGNDHVLDRSITRYKLRFAASLTDIGYINYKRDKNSGFSVSGSGYITGREIADSVRNAESFKKYALKKGFKIDTNGTDTKLYMPATLLLTIDYNLYKNFYVNATYMANLADRANYGNSVYNQFTITPRFDVAKFSAAVPISYSSLADNVRVGLGVRVLGFYAGSDDLVGILSNGQYGLNFYMGAFVPFNKHRIKDRDQDKVSDKRDRCPDDQGPLSNHGCPEKNDD
ncbi:MAG: hypothetical protein EBX41_08715 [Chitinophagia bacterium]|nr:hypothetical protein [Chitinophagia bacterium]